ncbi:MAG: protein translocase subunit SecD [Patescibacteria group bacterium]
MNKYAAREGFSYKQARLVALGLLLALAIGVGIAYPKPWNQAMGAMEDKLGFHLPYLPESEFRLGLDLRGGAHLVYEADMSAIPDVDKTEALSGVRDVVERRVNAFGVSEPVVQTTVSGGSYRVIVDLPGVTDVADAVREIGETPVLTFRLPDEEIEVEPTAEQEQQIVEAQVIEREAAVAVLDRALDGEDFGALAAELSIDASTRDAEGYVGFISSEDEEYGGLAEQIADDRLRVGVINGLYEGTSRIHIVKYLSRKVETEPRISHILVCYDGALSCTQSRTKEEALTMIEGLKDQATRSNFAELATESSDDTGSGQAGGDLGFLKPGDTVAPFDEAAFALSNNRISEVIETDFGYHILFRPESRSVTYYEIAQVEMPWTTLSDIFVIDPWINTELSGKHVQHASVGFDQNSGAPYVILDFNTEGADLFTKMTEENVGKVIGIFLDGEAITTPVVQQVIYGGQATITGNFSLTEAKLLAQRLNAGALPVPIEVVSQQTIGPALGKVSLDKSIQAGLVGFALIALYILVYYRLAGALAVVALAFYAVTNLALYKLLGVTITLSGIAGFVLSLGIAVDANVLIFERLKEELRSGRDLPTACDEAFRRAWPSIRDGNLTTLIATMVLYWIGEGFIRGFALTLTIGVLMSMVSAMVVTKVLLKLVVRYKAVRKPAFFLGLERK